MKKFRNIIIAFALAVAVICPAILFSACKDTVIELSFSGYETSTQDLSKRDQNKATIPSVENTNTQDFLGWATTQNATVAEIAKDAEITYNTVEKYAKDNKVTLYAVMKDNTKITVRFYDFDNTKWLDATVLQSSDLTKELAYPTINNLFGKQEVLGWTTIADRDNIPNDLSKTSDVKIATTTKISYNTIKDLQTNYEINIYPVIHCYDYLVAYNSALSTNDLNTIKSSSCFANKDVWYKPFNVSDIQSFLVNNKRYLDLIIGLDADNLSKVKPIDLKQQTLVDANNYAVLMRYQSTDVVAMYASLVGLATNDIQRIAVNIWDGESQIIAEYYVYNILNNAVAYSVVNNETLLGFSNVKNANTTIINKTINYAQLKALIDNSTITLDAQGAITLYTVYSSAE